MLKKITINIIYISSIKLKSTLNVFEFCALVAVRKLLFNRDYQTLNPQRARMLQKDGFVGWHLHFRFVSSVIPHFSSRLGVTYTKQLLRYSAICFVSIPTANTLFTWIMHEEKQEVEVSAITLPSFQMGWRNFTFTPRSEFFSLLCNNQ